MFNLGLKGSRFRQFDVHMVPKHAETAGSFVRTSTVDRTEYKPSSISITRRRLWNSAFFRAPWRSQKMAKHRETFSRNKPGCACSSCSKVNSPLPSLVFWILLAYHIWKVVVCRPISLCQRLLTTPKTRSRCCRRFFANISSDKTERCSFLENPFNHTETACLHSIWLTSQHILKPNETLKLGESQPKRGQGWFPRRSSTTANLQMCNTSVWSFRRSYSISSARFKTSRSLASANVSTWARVAFFGCHGCIDHVSMKSYWEAAYEPLPNCKSSCQRAVKACQ